MGVSNSGGGGGSATITGAMQGTAAARPAASTAPAGAVYWATDTGEIYINNLTQTTWQTICTISSLATGSLTLNGFLNFPTTALTSRIAWPGNQYIVGQGDNFIAIANPAGVRFSNAGWGIKQTEGANAKQGAIGAMTAGAIVVANTSVTSTSRIFVCRGAGGTNPGAWYVSAQTAGTSFAVASTNAADTGTGSFVIFESV